MIRPPPIGLMSYTLMSSDGALQALVLQRLRVVAALHRAVRAVDDERPLKVLPPSRGMTLRITPAVSASPRPPEVLSTTSCAPATFGMLPAARRCRRPSPC